MRALKKILHYLSNYVIITKMLPWKVRKKPMKPRILCKAKVLFIHDLEIILCNTWKRTGFRYE